MPFDFLRKKGKDEPKAGKGRPKQPERTPTGTPVPFDGLTEEWRLVGKMYLETRLSDALNKRESLAIADVQWAPIDGSSPFSPVPGLKSVDPYDLIVVIAGEPSKSSMSAADKAAALGQKTPYDVTLEAPPLRIEGRVYLSAGMAPERLMDRSAEMFVPVVGGVAYQGDRAVTDQGVDAVLVNRFYLRGVTVSHSGRSDDDQPLSQPVRAAPRPGASPPSASPAARAPQTTRPQSAPPWASRNRPGPFPAEPPPPQQAPAPVAKPKVVPDWPAADRKPEPQPKKAADIEWPAADRKPESRAAPRPPAAAQTPRPGADDPPAAHADGPAAHAGPPPAPEPVERPPERTAEASMERSSVAEASAESRASAQPAASAQPPASARPVAPAEASTAPPAPAEASAAPPASRAMPASPSPSRRDAGAKGWPAPESGCRPKRGGLGPRT